MKKRNNAIIGVLIMLLLMCVGLALSQSTLKINGHTKIGDMSWLIYFDNIRPNESNTATATQPAIITDPDMKTHIEFDVNLEKPGDFYEFDVYIKNDGTIDAIIDSIEFPNLTENQLKYMSFSYTYTDGTKIRKCDTLPANSYRDTRLRVEFLQDPDLSTMNEDGAAHIDVTIVYVQDGECEIPPNLVNLVVDPDGGIYDGSTDVRTITLTTGEAYTLLTPTKEGFDFIGWEEVTNTNSLTNGIITAGERNVEIKAIWVDS